MSLILKGIDMPRTGERVYAEIRPSGEVEYISVTYDKDYTRSAKVERTSAIQIPKGHGRLKDVDRLIRDEVEHLLYHLPNGDTAIPKVDIDNAPTILEEEE